MKRFLMKNVKFLQKFLFFMLLGVSVCALQACSEKDDEITPGKDVSNDYGQISKNSLVATGGHRDVKPLRATILSSINTLYQGAYTSMGVEFTPSQPNFYSSETRKAYSGSGVTNGHFETDLFDGEGMLQPGTTYYYRAFAYMAGTRYNGEIRSFQTPDLQVSKGDFVDLGVSVKWASHNMGAESPDSIGSLFKQSYAFANFNDKNDSDAPCITIPESVYDDNWLGNPNYDVATRMMGREYRLPTEWEWRELEENCNWKSGVCNGVKGFYIYDKIDGTAVIFLPYLKKNDQFDITVYLSAPDNLISTLREIEQIHEEYSKVMSTPNYHMDKYVETHNRYIEERTSLEESIGVGEVLTEKTHIYCYHGLRLCSTISWSEFLSDTPPGEESSEEPYDGPTGLIWTHPETGKEYDLGRERNREGNGCGVLYVRPVSNR